MSREVEVLPADDPAAIARAAEALRRGELVAFPTETVYGLGADALSAAAVRKIFAAKGRPADNPLIVHVAAAADVERLVAAVPAVARTLMARFWPGPLTLVFERSAIVPDATTAGQSTVAVRVPGHPAALALLRACGRPLAAPSANRSGRPSPTRAEHVLEDFNHHHDEAGELALILDGGACSVGLESTVVDVTRAVPLVLRVGGVTVEALRAAVGAVDVLAGQDPEAMARSPGLRHRHYAPRARVVLVGRGAAKGGEKVGVISQRARPDGFVGVWRAMPADVAGYGRELFAALRELDAVGVETIEVEGVPEEGLGRAIVDRLRRAAAG